MSGTLLRIHKEGKRIDIEGSTSWTVYYLTHKPNKEQNYLPIWECASYFHLKNFFDGLNPLRRVSMFI